jgi:hypothetical protein
MANNDVKKPKMKETNPGWKGAKSGTRVKEKKGPANKGVLATNPTKGGGIFRRPKSN